MPSYGLDTLNSFEWMQGIYRLVHQQYSKFQLLKSICIYWNINTYKSGGAYMHQNTRSSIVQIKVLSPVRRQAIIWPNADIK